MSGNARKRKWEPTASSEDYDQLSGYLSIELFMALKDPFRRAPFNKYTVPWPLETSKPSESFKARVELTRPAWTKVLSHFGINLTYTAVQGLGRKGFADTTKDTFIMETLDEDPSLWDTAATEILKLLEFPDCRVEIRNYKRMYRDVSHGVQPDSSSHVSLKVVEPLVLAKMKSMFPNLWKIISFVDRGPRDDNSIRIPTILIVVNPGMKTLWDHVQNQIEQILVNAKTERQVFVEIVPGLFVPGAGFGPKAPAKNVLPIMSNPPLNGSSIGPRTGPASSGTLGVWVWFEPKVDGNKKPEKWRCFLTCYHVIASGDIGNRQSNNRNGIGLNGNQVDRMLQVDYPAPSDAKDTKEHYSKKIADGSDSGGKGAQIIKAIEKYEKAGGIGSVIFASGNRRVASGRRMDWAIVRTFEQVPSAVNTPPKPYFTQRQMGQGHWEYPELPETVVRIADFEPGEWVAKIGRTTEVTVGTVNSIDAQFNLEDGTGESRPELEILSFPGGLDFVLPGDSGSMVINIKKECVGMIFGMKEGGENGYATPLKDIIDDVFKTTGGKLTLMT